MTDTGVYTITNPIDEVYVGQTTMYDSRMYNYTNQTCKNQTGIYPSIAKYGIANHSFELIMPLKDDATKATLLYWEQFFIHYFKGQGIALLNRKDIGEGLINALCKPVLQCTKQGEVVKEWLSIGSAANELNIQQTNIVACLTGKKYRHLAGGFSWKYKK